MPSSPTTVGLNQRGTSRESKGQPVQWRPNLVAAFLGAVVTFAYAGSFGQLVFDGVLAPHVGRGILTALISSIAVLLVLSWRSSFEFSVGGPDSNPSAVLAVTLSSLAHEVIASTGPGSPELLPTVLMYVFVSAVGCGLVVRLLGGVRGGRYARYIPHPVVGGFLAGTGYLLVAGAFKMLTGVKLSFDTVGTLKQAHPLAWATAGGVALVLVILTRRVRHYLVIPSVIVGSVLVFHAVRLSLGLDLENARALGLLLPRLELATWNSVASVPFSDVRWDLILMHAKDFAAMTTVVVLTGLLNTTSIELATGRDADADQELRAIGMSNVFAGIFGGMVGGNSFNRTLLNVRAGANSRWAARITALLILVVAVATPGLVGLLPRPVLTGLIFFLGFGLLLTWVVDSARTLTPMDYFVVLAILVIVIALGIVAGVVLGIFIACVSFVVTLSRSPNIRHAFTAQTRRANVERSLAEQAFLKAHGQAVRGYTLQGVLFFGTASRLLDEIRGTLANTRAVLLDFRLIHGIDGSSIVAMKRVHAICRDAGVELVLTALTPRMATLLSRGGFDLDAPHVRRFAELDRGLEWCEDFLLSTGNAGRTLANVLRQALSDDGVRQLFETCEHRHIAQRELLVRQGEPSDEMFFVQRGRVHVLLRVTQSDADSKRLRTYGAGTIVGEMGFYSGEPRSADILAEADTEVICITRERLEAIELSNPALARALHRHVILTLAQRVRAANDEIRLLFS